MNSIVTCVYTLTILLVGQINGKPGLTSGIADISQIGKKQLLKTMATSEPETTTISAVETSEKTNSSVIITLTLCSMALIVLILIAVYKRCWIKPSPRPMLPLPANRFEPFYLNILFRRECAQEIAEIEQHHYEEIPPQLSKGT